jgi:hypothetical protein
MEGFRRTLNSESFIFLSLTILDGNAVNRCFRTLSDVQNGLDMMHDERNKGFLGGSCGSNRYTLECTLV